MRGTKRIIPILMILLLLCGCSEEVFFPPTETDPQNVDALADGQAPVTSFKISYSSEDSFHPYEAETTANIQLLNLIYDPLFQLDSSYQARPFLAESVEKEGLTLTVTLKYRVPFSGGTYVTAEDVVFSFEAAAQSERFRTQLEGISHAEAEGEDTIRFILRKNDPYAENLLNFPIIKSQTTGRPEGTGRYTLQQDEDGYFLAANDNWFYGDVGFERIDLVNVPGGNDAIHSLESGALSYLFQDFSDGIYRRIGAGTMPVQLNNLVYLGMNQKAPALANANIRSALSKAVNKKELVSNAFSGYAVVANTPFNPSWQEVTQLQENQDENSITEATALLDGEGYSEQDEEGVRFSGNSRLHFRLLVNDNNLFRKNTAVQLADQLAEVGIFIEVIPLNWEEYINCLEKGDYDLYLGEIKLKNNMDLTTILTENGGASYGIYFPNEAASAYSDFLAGNLSMTEFLNSFDTAVPFLPLCYRTGIVAYNRNLKGNIQATENDIYFNLQDWLS